jgi:hypothetical protein
VHSRRLRRFAGILIAIAVIAGFPLGSLSASGEGSWSNGEKFQYGGEELYRYIDGGAEVYIRAGFKNLIVRDFTSSLYKDPIVAEIYEMAAASGAQQAYQKHLLRNGKPAKIGDEGSCSPGILHFRKSCFYYRIYTYNKLTDDRKTLMKIGKVVLAGKATSTPP